MSTDRFILGALIALGFSLLFNVVAVSSYLKQRDALVQARSEIKGANDDATGALEAAAACSASVDSLAAAADTLQLERDAARAAAAAKAKGHNARADAVLGAPAPVPGDACASAAARLSAWQGARLQEGAAP